MTIVRATRVATITLLAVVIMTLAVTPAFAQTTSSDLSGGLGSQPSWGLGTNTLPGTAPTPGATPELNPPPGTSDTILGTLPGSPTGLELPSGNALPSSSLPGSTLRGSLPPTPSGTTSSTFLGDVAPGAILGTPASPAPGSAPSPFLPYGPR
jgi:hypothetical protein